MHVFMDDRNQYFTNAQHTIVDGGAGNLDAEIALQRGALPIDWGRVTIFSNEKADDHLIGEDRLRCDAHRQGRDGHT
jgi:hypothetical protein